MFFKSEYDESQAGTFFSTNLEKLVKACLDEAMFYRKGKMFDNIIIYREGLNESGMKSVMKFEFDALYRAVEEVSLKAKSQMPRMCLIFVNRICDTKMFEYYGDEDKMDRSIGIENFSQSNKRSYRQDIGNVPVGTLIDHTIVQDNLHEFYLNSTFATEGTNNPTHYVVGFNSTLFSDSLIYQLTYNLTYYYYNTSKPLRFPSTLHRVIRRNKFIIDNIIGNINIRSSFIDLSL